MIQKKVCMVGLYGTGKTSLVQRFVHSRFSDRYLSTVGVKIDRKPVTLEGGDVTLVLWDLAGRDGHEDITASYLRGAHGVLYVADGTRRETYEQLDELRAIVHAAAGEVPSVLALNKSDLESEWTLSSGDEKALSEKGLVIRTSARSGDGVESLFQRLAADMLRAGEVRP